MKPRVLLENLSMNAIFQRRETLFSFTKRNFNLFDFINLDVSLLYKHIYGSRKIVLLRSMNMYLEVKSDRNDQINPKLSFRK